jgi:hypothetical protein
MMRGDAPPRRKGDARCAAAQLRSERLGQPATEMLCLEAGVMADAVYRAERSASRPNSAMSTAVLELITAVEAITLSPLKKRMAQILPSSKQ